MIILIPPRSRRALGLGLLLACTSAQAQPVEVSGDLPDGTTWSSGATILMVGNTRVPPGSTLTIQPGTIIKVSGYSTTLAVEGTLSAQGTAAAPIVFTDLEDDSAGGDTNNNGPSTGYPGRWGQIRFAPSSTGNTLEYVEVRYGGGGAAAAVLVEGAQAGFISCTVRHSRIDGLRILGSRPVVDGGSFHSNWGSALSMDLAADPAVSGIQVASNAFNGLSVDSGTLPADGSWDDPDVVYYLRGDVIVPADRRLTVGAGQIIKAAGTTKITVQGSLHALGTVAQPIVFTELRDDSAGGDSNNNGASSGYPGFWGRLEFTPASQDNELTAVEFRYGGASSTAQVLVDQAPVRFTRCTFRHSRSDSLRMLGSRAVVSQGYFHDNWGSALSMDLAANPAVSGIQVAANGINGLSLDSGILPADGFWDDPDVVYHLRGNVTVPAGRRLTVAAGQTVKSSGTTSVMMEGTLWARGTAAAPIVFTELRDDSAGGDTNNDGPSSGYPGFWGRLEFTATSQDNELTVVEFRFGGAMSPAAVVFSGTEAHLEAALVRGCSTHAVMARNEARVTLTSSVLCQNWGSGLRAESTAEVIANNNTLDNNERGVWADASSVRLANNLITSNRTAGITLTTGAVVTASHNNVHNPAAGTRNYDGLPVLTGTDGNVDVDPQYVDVARWNYALRPGSPVVDAGLGDGAPPADFLGQGRVDDPLHPNTGSGIPPYVDLGAFELDRWLSQLDTPQRSGAIVVGDTLRFTGTGRALDGPTQFRWDLGAGQSSALEDPGLITFRNPGTHTITFTTVAPDGTSDPNPASLELTVLAAPGPLPDLDLVQIVPPSQLAVEQPLEIRYLVSNRGDAEVASQTWSDALYLSSDPYLDASDVRLDARTISLTVAVGGSYTGILSTLLTSAQLQAGLLYLIVSVDDDWALLEQRQLNNEMGLPVDVAIPELRPGVPQAGRFARAGAGHYYRLEVDPGQNLRVRLDDANDAGINELYLRRGSLPTRTAFDVRFELAAQADQELVVAAPAPGVWYALAVAARVPDTGEYSVQADLAAITLSSVFPDRHGQLDGATFRLGGAGFIPGTTVELVGSTGDRYPARGVAVDSFTQLSVTLDLAALAPGPYAVRVQANGAQHEMAEALSVVSGGQARLETQLVVPEVVGYHQLATLYLEYRNTGNAAMPAPLLSLSAVQGGQQRGLLTLDATRAGKGLWVSGLPDGFSHSVHVLGSGEIAGWLHPGESGRIPVYYVGWLKPWDFTYPPIEFDLLATTTESVVPLDWPVLKATLKPGCIRSDAWEIVAANLEAEIGSTWGSLMRVLAENAAYLGQLGQRTSDAAALFAFELAQADNRFPFNRLESELDAWANTPGLPLVFERSFPALLSARFSLGPLGRGWTHCWDTSVESSADGSVVVRTRGGGVHLFQPDLRGGYLAPPGDSGLLTKLVDGRFRLREPDGQTSWFRADGRLESMQDANARRLTFDYTGTQLTRLRHSSGDEFQFAYNAAGRLTELTDAQGQVLAFAYDSTQEHLIEVRYPQGRVITYRYGTTGAQIHALLEKQDTHGDTRSFAYDNQGRVAAVAPNGQAPSLTLEYGPAGQVSITAGPTSGEFFFDAGGQLVKTRDAHGLVHQALYDSQGQLTQVIDPLGRTTAGRYDARGNLLSVTDALGQTTAFAYDSPGRLTAITDSRGQTTDYQHDASGNLTQVVYPDATGERYVYDAGGQITQWIRPDGTKIAFTYDPAGRVNRIQADDGTELGYAYDSRGNLTNTTDATGTTTYSYNASNQVIRMDLPGGRFLSFTYDAVGRRSLLADQTGFTVRYQYDGPGRLQRLADAQNHSLVEYQYDPVGRLERVAKGNGTSTTYGYNPAGRLVAVTNANSSGQILSRFVWTLDDSARVIRLELDEGAWNYAYDTLGQLVRARFVSSVPDLADQDLTFAYDAVGNRIRTVAQGAATDYTANSLNQYSQAGFAALTYDPRGNLTSRTEGTQTWRYAYDVLGRLVQVETAEGIWRYEYDALGNRVATIHGGQRQEFVFDPLVPGRVVGEYGGGALVAHYTQGLSLVSRVDAAGMPHYYDFDPLGSTVGLTGPAGEYVNRYLYRPFGDLLAAQQIVSNPFQFVGQKGVTSDGSGLYHMQARDYLPGLGRFLSRDPLGQPAGLNLYTYAANNPVSFIDPKGEDEGFPGFGVFLDGAGQSQTLYLFRNAYERGWGRFFQAMDELNLLSDEDRAMLDRSQQSFDAVLLLQNAWGWVSDTGGTLLNEGRNFFAERGAELSVHTGSLRSWLGNTWSGVQRDVVNWYNQELPKNIDLLTQWFSAMLPQVRSTVDNAIQWIGNQWNSFVVGSVDPNEKTGPAGGGTNHYVMGEGALSYRIDFENDAQATAPAQYVSIVDDLHEHLDWTTFELTEIAFGDHLLVFPNGTWNLATQEVIRDFERELIVDIRADLDLERGRLQVALSTLEPESGLPPEVALGFLPPEDGSGRGQGHVSYRIRPKAGLPSGTEIFNIAQITFDFSLTIATDQVNPHDPSQGTDPAKQARNTLDAAAPVSQVRPLPAVQSQAAFTLEWDAADETAGSGIAGVDLFVSVNDGPWTRWKENVSGNQIAFAAEPGNRYAFYSVAWDYAGHVELPPEAADAVTRIPDSLGVRLSIARDPQDGSLAVRWPTSPDQRYTLLEASNIQGPWNPVAGFVDVPGTGSQMLCPASPTAAPRFYRLQLP